MPHIASQPVLNSILLPELLPKKMRPAMLITLLICTLTQNSSANESYKYKSRKNRCDDKEPPVPQVQSVLEQPAFAAELHSLAVAVVKESVMQNSTLSAVRHVSRGGRGLPHVIEWVNEQLPTEIPPYLYSRPFILGGIAWLLYVKPSHVVEPGWEFFLSPIWSTHWGCGDEVEVTLDISMPHGGNGFKTRKGEVLTFSKHSDEGDHWLTFLPAAGPYDNAEQQGPPRSHILRLNFTEVSLSWATDDDEPTHLEASYYRACRDHQTLLQWAAMYGVGRRLHSTVQHSLRRVHTLMYNEYLWNGETYYQDSRVQLIISLASENIRCHLGGQPAEEGKVTAIMAMMQIKAGITGHAEEYVDVVPDPTVEGGVRYLDAADGEDLGRYGTECAAQYNACAAAEEQKQELKAFYDGLRDPIAKQQQHHTDTALLMYSALRAYISDELQKGFADWGAEWYRLRNAPAMRRALRSTVPEVDRKGITCMASVPPEGPVHELEWFVYKTFSIWHLVGIADAEWQEPFTAGGLVWFATLHRDKAGTRMVLRPNVDLRRDIKAVRGTVRYEMLSGHLNGTGLPASTRGNGAFVIRARNPNVTLWSLPSGGPSKGQGVTLPLGTSPDMVVRLYVNASVEWREGAKGPARAVYEAAYQQLQLLRVADFLNVGQRLRKTVRFHVTGPAGNDSAVQVVLERRDKHYSLDDAHELLDELVQENLLCLTGSKEIASTKRSAVMGMNILRRARTPFQNRADLAPKVVVLHPDMAAAAAKRSGSKKGGSKHSSDASKPSKGSASPTSSAQILDDYGYDLVQYDEECTADLHGLVYDTFFGHDDAEYIEGCRKGGMLMNMIRFHVLFWEACSAAGVIAAVHVSLRVVRSVRRRGKQVSTANATSSGTSSSVEAVQRAADDAVAGSTASGHGGPSGSRERGRGGAKSGGKKPPGRAKGPGGGGAPAAPAPAPAAAESTATLRGPSQDTPAAQGAQPHTRLAWLAWLSGVLPFSWLSKSDDATPSPQSPTAGGPAAVAQPLDARESQSATGVADQPGQQVSGQQLRKRRGSSSAAAATGLGALGSAPEAAQARSAPVGGRVQAHHQQQQQQDTRGQQGMQGAHAGAELPAVVDAVSSVGGVDAFACVNATGGLEAEAAVQQQQLRKEQERAPVGREDDEDEAVCLVCHDGPRQWGFLHGGSVHVGVCGECRELVRARAGAGGAVSCPVCREHVDGIIKLIQA